MKFINFMKWLFDISKWSGYSKRMVIYMVLGFGGLYFTQYAIVFLLGATFIDFTIQILHDRWQEFSKQMDKELS